ncbi:hypothetical protein SH580_14065 [Coraliomargarita algicola]|uniref:Uncharacterized protein n=1 Tax=Coraliomargarita algicola TaxID=3092156 RepID=A0ABZ0REU8_9BACT|nr:hypothetical protein [Coraliomargarita sp. J2-16]WPJ94556.1 hypothetical protein SH580_14065 [Coraliomargarita sp. J2-16]
MSDTLELEPREAQPFTRETTMVYLHVMEDQKDQTLSPLDVL